MIMYNKNIPVAAGPDLKNGHSHNAPYGVKNETRKPLTILGVTFDPVTMEETVMKIADMVESQNPHFIVTPNVDILVQARFDAELHQNLLAADLVLCDGMPLVWASRWLGNPLPDRVAGSDLTPRIIEQAERLGHRLFFLGATPDSNANAVARVRKQYPGVMVAGHYSPPFAPLEKMDNQEIVKRIQAARPDIVLVSFGCPKQEKWIARHYQELGVPVCIGVGAVIDFLAGQMKRAPTWMHPLGLECVYRMFQEPRRLIGRYGRDLRHYTPAILSQCWQTRRWMRAVSRHRSVEVNAESPDWIDVHVTGCLNRKAIENQAEIWGRVGLERAHCRVNLERVDYIDSTGVAFLWERRKRLLASGYRLVLEAPNASICRLLSQMNLKDYFEIRPLNYTPLNIQAA